VNARCEHPPSPRTYRLADFAHRCIALAQEIISALARAHLPKDILDWQITPKGGGNLSAGQRQLLCFARALLHHAPIVIMDEPTANCDMQTDELVQELVQEAFRDVTVPTTPNPPSPHQWEKSTHTLHLPTAVINHPISPTLPGHNPTTSATIPTAVVDARNWHSVTTIESIYDCNSNPLNSPFLLRCSPN